MDLAEHLYRRAVNGLDSITAADRADTYVVSIYVEDEDDDPRRPTVTVGTNTERQVRIGCDETDEEEARWNYAFWLQNDLAVICDTTVDPVGRELRERWIRSSGWWYEDDDEDEVEGWDEAITAGFVRLCVSLARRLHEEGDVVRLFGRPIPVLVHELEYYDEIAEQNVVANPPGLAQGLVDWIGLDGSG